MANNSSFLEVKDADKKGKGIYAKKSILRNEVILSINHDFVLLPNSSANALAIQVDEDLYIQSRTPQIWQFWNHSCEPNTMFNTQKFEMVAIKDIMEGEEITYHYCTTEFDLISKNEHFNCFCGSKNCIKIVGGFKHLPHDLRLKLAPYLANYLKRRI